MPKENKGHHGGPPACQGPTCDWVKGKGSGDCVDGTGGCVPPPLLEAYESSFHDKNLQEATKKINRILARIPEDTKGRQLSFCETNMGLVLGWVKHGGKAGSGPVVTRRDDDAKVIKALKLKVKEAKKR